MKKKEEENALDALLRNKLENLEDTPAPELWSRIEKRQKRPQLRIWYAAACLLAGITGGLLLWPGNTRQQEEEKVLVKGPVKKQVVREKPLVAVTEPGKKKETKQEVAVQGNAETFKTDRGGERVATGPAKTGKMLAKAPVPDGDGRPGVEIRTLPAVKTTGNPPPVIARREVPVQADVTQAVNRPDGNEVVTGEIPVVETAIAAAAPTAVAEARTASATANPTVLMVYVEPAPDPPHEVKKKKGLQRVFRQLRRMKQGEGVAWDELGFNPKKVLARMDYELTEPGGKLSKEYRNLKEKTSF